MAAVREERKVVTVLFADLVGFTERSERLDPEDVRAALSSFHAHLRWELERFGGTVEKFIGDAVMAVFGAPAAHEDDPERAVRAALAIRDWAAEQEELQLRIAVNTGEALVSAGTAAEGMVAGDVVNTAARLQSAAPVNGILVGEQTYRATEQRIDYRAHEPVLAKGKTEPVPVWEAVEPRARLGVDVRQLSGAPFVGRREELAALVAALARARDGAAQLVTLVGEPGIGKSRLVFELLQIVDAGVENVYWRQGRSLPYGDGVTFWALGEMVKSQAGILETDAPEEADRKLADAVPDEWVRSHLRPLVGLAAEREPDRTESFAAWRQFFETLAAEYPLVLVFEDLHWADDVLLDFVDHLVEWAGGVPLLVVCTARPELLARRPGWAGGKANATTLSVAPLSDEETARLVHDLVERAVIAADVRSQLLERAGGNPLYTEEFVRMLAQRDDRGLALPESVQGLIAARLDELPREEKELLQTAAVIGKVFWLGAVVDGGQRWAVEQLLHSLERKEFIRRERRSSVASETEFAFRHQLVRDVAYGQILRAARVEKHRRAAEWIESLGRPADTPSCSRTTTSRRSISRARRAARTDCSGIAHESRSRPRVTGRPRWGRSRPRIGSTPPHWSCGTREMPIGRTSSSATGAPCAWPRASVSTRSCSRRATGCSSSTTERPRPRRRPSSRTSSSKRAGTTSSKAISPVPPRSSPTRLRVGRRRAC